MHVIGSDILYSSIAAVGGGFFVGAFFPQKKEVKEQ